MLHRCAEMLTDKLFQVCNIENSKSPVFIYGFELALSTISSIISILVISACLSILPTAIVFLISFCSLRMFCGGYHAKTYGRCFILTNIVYIVTIGCAFISERYLLKVPLLIIGAVSLFFSVITIFVLAPVKNIHHPLSQEKYLKNRKRACVLSVTLLLFTAFVLFLGKENTFVVISFTLTAVAVMMIVPKLQERRT